MIAQRDQRAEPAKMEMRNTRQRALILDIIRRGHLDADEIYLMARQENPRISLSTVYRTLQKLKNMGVIDEHRFDEAHHHYELKSDNEHHHLVCLGCSKIIEFQHPITKYINQHVAAARGFQIATTEVKVSGYCRDCQKKQK
ncbi:Fur family transcriptional regulator [Chloroflexota bacterium]